MSKRRHSSGETLIETLAALLLVTLSSVLLLQMTITSGKISARTRARDSAYRAALAAAEEQSSPVSTGTVQVDGRAYSIVYFFKAVPDGEGQQLVSYASAEDGG